jgi:acetolactate synthase-1/2/3 large subunit
MNRSASRLLVDCLVEQGCDRIFTVPGESFLPVLDALADCPAIDTVTCRQEGGAAFMACADPVPPMPASACMWRCRTASR